MNMIGDILGSVAIILMGAIFLYKGFRYISIDIRRERLRTNPPKWIKKLRGLLQYYILMDKISESMYGGGKLYDTFARIGYLALGLIGILLGTFLLLRTIFTS